MAYKNKKKNKIHVKKMHKSLLKKKHEREKQRNNSSGKPSTMHDLKKMLRERGLI
jgi:hypothetical protein